MTVQAPTPVSVSVSEPGPVIDIDLDAIRANVAAIARCTGTPLLAVVKANAYGHGAVQVARAALQAGAMRLGVVDIREALALRAAGITAPILVWMHGPNTDWSAAVSAGLEVGISSLAQLELLDIGLGRLPKADLRLPLHLKLDTGLGRNGISEVEWEASFAKVRELEERGVVRLVGMFSHFAGAGEEGDRAQLASFEEALAQAAECGLHPVVRHLAATAGALSLPEARFDLVRLGISMYGLSPFGPEHSPGVALRPALRLTAPLLRDEHGFFVEVGTADGLPPVEPGMLAFGDSLGGSWHLQRLGTRRLRVTAADEATRAGLAAQREGEQPAVLSVIDERVGSGADAWAAAAGTINYEVVTRLSERLPRRWQGAADPVASAPSGSKLDSVPRLAPKRDLLIDIDVLRARMGVRAAARAAAAHAGMGARHAGRLFSVDVSADAYGHGAALIGDIVVEYGLSPLVAARHDLTWLSDAARASAIVDHELTRETSPRDVYGFGDVPQASLAMLVSELVHVKRVGPGHGVSYGYDWVAPTATTLGLVPLGYADAIPRVVAGRAEVTVAGVRRPVVGRVAMDQIVVDLQDQEAWVGMPVTIFGADSQDVDLRTWASWAGVAPEAFTAAIGSRVDRGELRWLP